MIKERLFEVNKIQRSADVATAMAGPIMFDGFLKAMKIEEILNKHVPKPDSNRV